MGTRVKAESAGESEWRKETGAEGAGGGPGKKKETAEREKRVPRREGGFGVGLNATHASPS